MTTAAPMMPDVSSDAVARLSHIDPRDVWKHEAHDFTRWLAENLDALGEILGVDLEHERTEHRVGDFAADIIARVTGSSRRVLIENQLAPTDHRHLGQLLTYAAGTEAALVVWISPTFREEHRQALDWLNQRTSDGIDFFGVTLDVVRIDQSRPAINLRLVSAPNAWSKHAKKVMEGGAQLSDSQRRYQSFFEALLADLRAEKFTNARQAATTNWQNFPTGITGFAYSVSFGRDGRLRTELYIDLGDKIRNKGIFDHLLAQKEAIERSFGRSLQWDRLDERRASRVADFRPGAALGVSADGELRQWVMTSLEGFRNAFKSRLRAAILAVDAAIATPLTDSVDGGIE